MLITINILSAMSIVMALFIPYFILLHLNNKLRKEVESALNRILELKVYSEENREQLIDFAKSSNHNFEGQDKNWENYHEQLNLIQEALSLCNENFKGMEENFNYIINEIDDLNEL